MSVCRNNAGAQIIPADGDFPNVRAVTGGELTELSESIEEGEKAVAWAVATDSRFALRRAGERGFLKLHVGVQVYRCGLNLFVPEKQRDDGAIGTPAEQTHSQ